MTAIERSIVMSTETTKTRSEKGRKARNDVLEYLDTQSGQVVSIKPKPEIESVSQARAFLKELRIRKKLKQKNIPCLKHIAFKRTMNFFKFYFIEEQWEIQLNMITKHLRHQMKIDHIKYICYQLFTATSYLHSCNLIHKNINLRTVMINKSSDIGLCDLRFDIDRPELDFSIRDGVIKRNYFAPEVLFNARRLTEKIDIWAIGCCLYEMLFGESLSQNKNYISVVRSIYRRMKMSDKKLTIKEKRREQDEILKMLSKVSISDFLRSVGHENEEALDLLSKCLEIDPRKRISARKALKHPFLSKYYKEEDLMSEFFWVNSSFHADESLNLNQLKLVIMAEINEINKETGAEELDITEFKYFMGLR